VEARGELWAQRYFDFKPLVTVPAIAWSSPKITSKEGPREKELTPDTLRFCVEHKREGRGCHEACAGSRGDLWFTQDETSEVS
jgi:hypothetical protein